MENQIELYSGRCHAIFEKQLNIFSDQNGAKLMVTPHGVFSAEGFLCSNCNYIKDGVVVGPLYLWFWLAK